MAHTEPEPSREPEASLAEPTEQPATPPAFKDCRACTTRLPARARYCSRCGEPQLEGLQRPEPLALPASAPLPTPTPVPGVSAASPATPEPPAGGEPAPAGPPVRPSQVAVPSVPRVPPPRGAGAAAVPMLAFDRPIPLSLLNPGAALPPPPPPAALMPELPRPAAPDDHAHHLPPVAAEPPAAPGEEAPRPKPEAAETAPLFAPAIDARILALRSGREITGERFDRLMAGFKLRPKRVVRKAAKPAEKAADGKADKKADKKAEKAAKGH